ncbi:MAG: sigma-70 family RNA polymerase sigma factor [Solirubrobacterales bacterium]
MSPGSGGDGCASIEPSLDAARKRAAVETYARHEVALRRTARRYSLCADDADEALQRALEILLKKAPSNDPRELIRWTQTVLKHEALAVRRDRERILSGPAAAIPEPGREDWVALIPSGADGPAERAERREAVARSREALQALKPQELRALTLLAEGYSYVEIGEITGFSRTKVNRCLAEGRERLRRLISQSEDGRRCEELGSLLSAFCDGEAGADEVTVREHLRACAHCRATLRVRAAPAAVAALADPAADRSARAGPRRLRRARGSPRPRRHLRLGPLPGGGDRRRSRRRHGRPREGRRDLRRDRGAAACVATGVMPAPLEIAPDHVKEPS